MLLKYVAYGVAEIEILADHFYQGLQEKRRNWFVRPDKVHNTACPQAGKTRSSSHSCPSRLTSGTVDSLLGKLRAIFAEARLSRKWGDSLGFGNPVSHSSIKSYLKLIKDDRARTRVWKAVPLFLEKLGLIAQFILIQLQHPWISPISLSILNHNLCFFTPNFFSRHCSSGLDRVLSREVSYFPYSCRILFNHIPFGKTLRANLVDTFAIRHCKNLGVCLIKNSKHRPYSQPPLVHPNVKAEPKQASPTDDPQTSQDGGGLQQPVQQDRVHWDKECQDKEIHHCSLRTCQQWTLPNWSAISACLHQICPRAEQNLLQLMTHQQEKNNGSNTKALTDLKETLATMFPDKNKPNGGSSMLPADPLSESTSPNHLPDTSRMQLTNSLY